MSQIFRSVVATLVLPLALVAQPVTPAGTFGSLPANSFGGSGIPTDAVLLGTVNGVTIGLSATPRYASPALTNNGAGTFFAQAGQSVGAPVNTGFAGWNFDYFVGGVTGRDFFTLFVDTDPAVGNPLSSLTPFSFGGNAAGSSNLGYFPGFDPFAPGEYSFALYHYADSGSLTVLDHVAINVDVGVTATPEPATVALTATGLLALVGLARRRRA